MEKTVETKICKHCSISFVITDKDLEFYEKVSPVSKTPPTLPLSGEEQKLPPDKRDWGGYKYHIPTPTLCPDCRQQRRISFANITNLYKRKCDATGKDIISMYSPDKNYTVYSQEVWWGDTWSALDYGRDFDFSKNFFSQIENLIRIVPKITLSTERLENSPYLNYCWNVKNCYLCFISAFNEDCYYCYGIRFSKNCVDCIYSKYMENCYALSDCLNCYECFFLKDSSECKYCEYSQYLQNCTKCLFCSHLIGKDFYFLNQKISKEGYEWVKEKLLKDKIFFQETKKKYENMIWKIPQKCHKNMNIENCNGEYILMSQNIQNWFDISLCQDCKYVTRLFESKNCYDIYMTGEKRQKIVMNVIK